MNTTQKDQTVTQDTNTDYASQWIEYLKKKNSILSIIWPILLIISILSFASAFYFFQLSEKNQVIVVQTQLEVDQLSKRQSILDSDLSNIKTANKTLEQTILTLSSAKNQLELQKGDSTSQLNLSGQIVDTLKDNIAALTKEKKLLQVALAESQTVLITQKSDISKLSSKTQKNSKTRLSLQKKLNERKIAYTALAKRQKEMRIEMNRLADGVDKQQREITLSLNQTSTVQNKLNAAFVRISSLKIENKALEQKLISSISAKINSNKKPTQNSIDDYSGDGLEEIQMPVKNSKKIRTTGTNFSFDNIINNEP